MNAWNMQDLWAFANKRAWRSPPDCSAMSNLLAAALAETGPIRFALAKGGSCVVGSDGSELRVLDDKATCRAARVVPVPDLGPLPIARRRPVLYG